MYAPDLRGHGRSEWAGTYACEAMRDDIRDFLTVLGIERADVIGHSLGGTVVLLLAQRAPGLVRRLVLEDVPSPLPPDPPRPEAERPDGDLPFDWAMVLATDRQRNAPDPLWWEHMGRIAVPTLVIGGGPSRTIPQDQVAAVAAAIRGAGLVTVDAGHLVHETCPDEFLSVVVPFLARTPS